MRWMLPTLIIALIAGSAWLLWPQGTKSPAAGDFAGLDMSSLTQALASEDDGVGDATDGETLPDAVEWRYRFPGDHGAHPDARAEVWDVSGQLADANGQQFGFRLSLVRVALLPPRARAGERSSALAADAVITGRFALSLERLGETRAWERVSRAAVGLAGAESAPKRVWLEDWTLTRQDDGGAELEVATDDARLVLSLTPDKQPVTAADAGLFRRAAGAADDAGASSEFSFYMLPRLAAKGSLELKGTNDGRPLSVVGTAWLDHAWGGLEGVLNGVAGGGGGQLALNRFALQLDDGSELMCIQLRRRAGGGTPIPTCLAIALDGGLRVFERRDLSLEPVGKPWRNPVGDADWPLAWRLAVPALDLELTLKPLADNQELSLGERLWSGAVRLSGQLGGKPIAGVGRMDLSGYAHRVESG